MTYLITILQRHRDIWSILWHLRYQWFSISLKGRPRSLILAPFESAYMTSYWSSVVVLVISCRFSEILELLYAKSHFFRTHPYFGQNFGLFPLD